MSTSVSIAPSMTVIVVDVRCPTCDRNQPVRVPPGTYVDCRCHRCGMRFTGVVHSRQAQ